MRGTSLDATCPQIFGLELTSYLIPQGAREESLTCRSARAVATLANFTTRRAFTMRGISLDAKRPHILVPETSLDLMPKGTLYLLAPRRIARATAAATRFSSQCAFTMRGRSLDAKCHHFLVLELSSDFMPNGTHN